MRVNQIIVTRIPYFIIIWSFEYNEKYREIANDWCAECVTSFLFCRRWTLNGKIYVMPSIKTKIMRFQPDNFGRNHLMIAVCAVTDRPSCVRVVFLFLHFCCFSFSSNFTAKHALFNRVFAARFLRAHSHRDQFEIWHKWNNETKINKRACCSKA